jgi:uncharacterized membrane protein YgcG
MGEDISRRRVEIKKLGISCVHDLTGEAIQLYASRLFNEWV